MAVYLRFLVLFSLSKKDKILHKTKNKHENIQHYFIIYEVEYYFNGYIYIYIDDIYGSERAMEILQYSHKRKNY